ncbi:RNA polymerase I associated factor, A49-like protein [Radiomyces spectabilis]|uniref:RNA polymerase I associated factor, A49-like protein n=1 Tax=Radiomyces spectabilis TaxID=64574 RepID=UPI002220337B|nr:RNA polymerase I associated factor, A49-like protein [Radiomyces spectabilis]KAI8393387.1 RNA polymerase I associated factor, A49-like protein [Radiomyces spectabilis]
MGKRKHAEGSESKSGKHIKVSLAKKQDNIEPPFLAAFPGTQPSSDTRFTPYKLQGDVPKKRQNHRFVSGETEKVVFSAANFGDEAAQGVYCKYLVGVFSKEKQELTVAPTSVMAMRRKVKALMSSTSEKTSASNTYGQARAALGLAFGTAKAKAQLRDEERNLVKGEELEDVMASIHHEIGKSTANTPSQAELRKEMEKELPIPAHNMEATTPEEAYDISSIVTDDELNAVPVKDLLKETTLEGVQNLLPFSLSSFVNDRVMAIIKGSGKKDRKKLRMVVYISYLMAYLRKIRPDDLKQRRRVEAALQNPPSIIVDKLTERFTISNVRTPLMADKILCYLFVLCLYVADFKLYPDSLSKDLSIKPSKAANMLRNLGCKIDKCTAEEISAAGFDSRTSPKKAVLVVPLKFPEIRKGKRKQ